MTSTELFIALISIMFIFDSATIHLINISFTTLLIIYISSIIEISVIYGKIKGKVNLQLHKSLKVRK